MGQQGCSFQWENCTGSLRGGGANAGVKGPLSTPQSRPASPSVICATKKDGGNARRGERAQGSSVKCARVSKNCPLNLRVSRK